MPGGHSSIPSDHTSIGVLSELIRAIESEQYATYLKDDNPYFGQLQCGAANSADFPKDLKKLLEEVSNLLHSLLAKGLVRAGSPCMALLWLCLCASDLPM